MWKQKYQQGDVVKVRGGLATVLSSTWITVCDGWHPDKRRTEEELRIMTQSGELKCVLAHEAEGPIIRAE